MINYGTIDAAVHFYEDRGYRPIEVPWLVSESISDITRPQSAAQYFVDKLGRRKAFVASGEQGFLYLVAKGNLAPGKYQTVTPCLRNDDFDETHVKYFVKLELIDFGGLEPNSANERYRRRRMIEDSLAFFSGQTRLLGEGLLGIVNVDGASDDINLIDTELGSYGVRECQLTRWIYGTGVAEPRFSRALSYHMSRKAGAIRHDTLL